MGNLGKPASNSVRGFTLIELSMVMLIFGMIMLVALPIVTRNITSEPDPFRRLSLWMEIIHERSQFRGEVFLIEIDPDEDKMRVVQPREVNLPGFDEENSTTNSGFGSDDSAAPVELMPVDDPFFNSEYEIPEDWELDDVQDGSGTRFTRDIYYLVVYPYGWIDPLAFHFLDENRDAHTGFINSVTGRIDWHEGYRERILEDEF